MSLTTDHDSMPHPVTTPSDHTYWAHTLIPPTSHIFQPYISSFFPSFLRNVKDRLVGMISVCVCAVVVVAGCGYCVER